MAKVLKGNGITGQVSISNPGADVSNPLSDLGNIFFHSDLEYIPVHKVINTSVSLPTRSGLGAYYTTWNHGLHGLPYSPIAFGIASNGLFVGGDMFLQYESGTGSFRSFRIGCDSSYVYTDDWTWVVNRTFSGFTLGLTIYILALEGL